MRSLAHFIFLNVVLLFCAAFTVPPLTGPVVDEARMIKRDDQKRLEELLRQANERGHIQLQILTVASLEGESIEQASIRVTDQWKLGTAKGDNGVLLMVAKDDRKVRIEVGQGLEGTIPDIYASRIVRDAIVPLFASGDYSRGIYVGALQVLRLADPQLVEVEAGQVAQTYQRRSRDRSFNLGEIGFIILFIIIFILGGLGRHRRRGFRGVGYGGLGGWGGGGGWGGSSGGGWSGGGGGFSGGGASGSW